MPLTLLCAQKMPFIGVPNSLGGTVPASVPASLFALCFPYLGLIAHYPPLQKYYQQLFLFVGLISSGLPEKWVTWLPEIISGELIPWDYWKVWPGLSAV